MVARLKGTLAERGAKTERSFAALGQSKRPCEEQIKAGPARDIKVL